MNKLMIAVSIYLVLMFSGFITYKLFFNQKEINIEQGQETLEILDNKLQNNHVHHEHNHEDEAGYDYDEEMVKIFRDIEKTLSFFVSVIKEENEQYFASMFLPEQLSKDLWNYSDNPHKEKAVLKLIKELNRDGKLVSAHYEENFIEEYKTTRLDSDIKITLLYEDGKEAELRLNLVLVGNEHSNENHIYFIENSVLELVEEVRKQTSQ